MGNFFQLGPHGTVEIFGIKLLGVSSDNARKLLLTVAFIVTVLVVSHLLRSALRVIVGNRGERVNFWVRQGIKLLTALVILVGLGSVWFSDPKTLATVGGMVAAGLAFALQRVVTAVAGYFVILRGKTFNVGDRIMMGGVRGDVIALGFMQTTIMEMGQPPGEQGDAPSMWVLGRQYTGRIVTITNAKIFDEPVYNYTRDFPYLWDEMMVPISYKDDRKRAERILLDAAEKHTVKIAELSEEALQEMERRYLMKRSELKPRVFFRITDNWVEMSLRFIAREHGIRALKDAMSRDILDALDQANIGIASGTYDIVGLPEVKVRLEGPAGTNGKPRAQ